LNPILVKCVSKQCLRFLASSPRLDHRYALDYNRTWGKKRMPLAARGKGSPLLYCCPVTSSAKPEKSCHCFSPGPSSRGALRRYFMTHATLVWLSRISLATISNACTQPSYHLRPTGAARHLPETEEAHPLSFSISHFLPLASISSPRTLHNNQHSRCSVLPSPRSPPSALSGLPSPALLASCPRAPLVLPRRREALGMSVPSLNCPPGSFVPRILSAFFFY
jgi:hypothetical protein